MQKYDLQLPYAEKIEIPTFCKQSSKKSHNCGSGALAELFFICSQGLSYSNEKKTENPIGTV
jgi:hypothetical protein